MLRTYKTPATRAAVTAIALLSSASLLVGQTQIIAPPNKYKLSDDVREGQAAARQVEQQLPLLNDAQVESYVANIGARLAESIPPEFQHPEFQYTFKVVNVSDINAFALPGGPMYVNRGMIEAAKTEGEVAGVMAHEMSHVALRHGTAEAGKAAPLQVGSIAGQILGAIIGGTAGQVLSAGSQFGAGLVFTKFSREYEKQADLLGSHIMANAGYDPRDMANVFKTIEKISGNGGPQFLSDHPNPANRYQYINDEASMLRVVNPIHDSRAFVDIQNRLRRMPPAPTTEQATKQGNRRSTQGGYPGGTQGGYPGGNQPAGRVDPPAAQFRTYDEGNVFRISVPANWQELPGNTAVTFAPQGGYGDYQGQNVFTHGLEVGTNRNESHDLRTATDELIASLTQSNPQLQSRANYNSISIAGHRGLHTVLNNISDVTRRQEQIELFTAQLNDGSLFYVIGVAPTTEFGSYQRIFNQAVRSIQVNDGYSNSRY
jgi:hypothetical protein